MKLSNYKYKLCLWKAYFEKGYALTNYIKYIIILFGISEGFASQNLHRTFVIVVIYAVFCFLLGWVWFRFAWINAEIEVGNRFNEFVKEMRNSKLFKEKKS